MCTTSLFVLPPPPHVEPEVCEIGKLCPRRHLGTLFPSYVYIYIYIILILSKCTFIYYVYTKYTVGPAAIHERHLRFIRAPTRPRSDDIEITDENHMTRESWNFHGLRTRRIIVYTAVKSASFSSTSAFTLRSNWNVILLRPRTTFYERKENTHFETVAKNKTTRRNPASSLITRPAITNGRIFFAYIKSPKFERIERVTRFFFSIRQSLLNARMECSSWYSRIVRVMNCRVCNCFFLLSELFLLLCNSLSLTNYSLYIIRDA